MKLPRIFLVLLVIALVIYAWQKNADQSVSFPAERFSLPVPDSYSLGPPAVVVENEKRSIGGSIQGYLFRDCEVSIEGNDLQIKECEFINSPVFVNRKNSISFERVIFQGLNRYEQAALTVYDADYVSVTDCRFLDNYIGLGVHKSDALVKRNRFENNNGHNALVIGEGASVVASENYFYGSFPHAILVMNRENSPAAAFTITGNTIDQTGEDAIDIEDYRNASPGVVSHNVITNTGWSAVVVEYNSWAANVNISDNWIENTGIEWRLNTHPLQPDSFRSGSGHGVLIEDSSMVLVENNRITASNQCGIDIINGRNIAVRGNGIDCAETAIRARGYMEASLYRHFSPLLKENAGGSRVVVFDNRIYEASSDYEVDAVSEIETGMK